MNTRDELVQCPYVASHTILKKRFQVHLVRCRKNFLHTSKVTCPFNVTHILNEPELDWHVQNCPNRAGYEHYKRGEEQAEADRATTSAQTQEYPLETEENWDDLPPVPTYNPQEYAENAQVLRNLRGQSKSVKKQFRSNERLRLMGINRNKELKE